MKRFGLLILFFSLVIAIAVPTVPVLSQTLVTKVEAEAMTRGTNVGTTSGPFTGVNLCCNGAFVSTNVTFSNIPGRYRFDVRGASSAANAASVSVNLNGTEVAVLTFPGTAASIETAIVDIMTGTATQEVKLLQKTDTGANDTLLDYIEIYHLGIPPTPTPPPPPASGSAFTTGVHRNMFKEAGKTDAEIQAKIDAAWNQLFYGDDTNQRLYYPVGTDMAYIKDIGNGDVRSEGISYGLMIAVQLNKREEFDRIWRWAKTYMLHTTGERKGYFAWQLSTSGSKMDNNPASDGEEWFVTALFFASARWGNSGAHNYQADANAILDVMLHKEDQNGGVVGNVTNMFDRNRKQVTFVPYGDSASFTDPSYHLPAYYELWARWAAKDNGFWYDAAAASRQLFHNATHPTTGLYPDYSTFDGAPKAVTWATGHEDFRFDAWRVAANIAMDYTWFGIDPWQVEQSNRLLNFFYSKGITSYGNQYRLDGTQLSADHSPGLVAMNAVAALASTNTNRWEFVEELWNTAIPSGQWRYYDGLLYTMAMLHLSGNFRIWKPGNIPTPTAIPPTNTPTRTNTPCTSCPTNTPVPTNTPTTAPTRTNTPVVPPAGLSVEIKNNGTDNNQQTGFSYRVRNTGTTSVSNISVRIYFTTDGSNAGSGYVLEKFYDQSGVATLSAPTLASGSTYYITVNYGTTSLAANGAWEFQTALHLTSWGSTYSAANDWFHTNYAVGALPAAYTATTYIPAYVSGTRTWGNEPGTTNTPQVPTNTAVPPTTVPPTTVPPTTVPPTTMPATATRTATRTPTRTSTRTNTPIGPTPTRSNTPVSPTRTNTPVPPTTVPPTTVPPTTVPPTAVPPTSVPPTTAPSTLKVQYKAADTMTGDNQIKPHVRIVNSGSTAVALSTLKIRYYLTRDNSAGLVFNCDWAQVGCGNLSAAFVAATGTNTDTYLEISFAAGAGSVAAGGNTGDIQARINHSDWTNFNEANDYSFDATKTAFADWNRVVLLQNGVVVWGTTP